MKNNLEKVYFAGGCFWGVEYHFQNLEGVISTQAGYIGGKKNNPTYEQVCQGDTGHAEAMEVIFDNQKINFEKIAKLFFEIHDPTQIDGQGSDLGNQYRSEIFFTNQEQKIISEKLIKELEKSGYQMATKLTKASTFWKAEDYHQKYYQKNDHQPHCHIRQKRFKNINNKK